MMPGSARGSRAHLGALGEMPCAIKAQNISKKCDRDGAIDSTRGACAPQKFGRSNTSSIVKTRATSGAVMFVTMRTLTLSMFADRHRRCSDTAHAACHFDRSRV